MAGVGEAGGRSTGLEPHGPAAGAGGRGRRLRAKGLRSAANSLAREAVAGWLVGVRGLEAPSRDENLVRGGGAAAGRLSSVCPSVRRGRVPFWISCPKTLIWTMNYKGFLKVVLRFCKSSKTIRF